MHVALLGFAITTYRVAPVTLDQLTDADESAAVATTFVGAATAAWGRSGAECAGRASDFVRE
jgi:hypothetical protein